MPFRSEYVNIWICYKPVSLIILYDFFHSSFDSPVPSGDDDEIMSPSQYLEDKRYDPEIIVASEQAEQVNKEELLAALKTLDDRSKDILNRRYLSDEKATLHDLADEYKVSAERIRQIENSALKKLKAFMVDFA